MFQLDFTNLLAAAETDLRSRMENAEKRFQDFREQRVSTFHEMVGPEGKPYLDEVLEAARELRERQALKNFVNLGIGGSALGGEAVLRALLHPLQNERPVENGGFSRYYFPDNVDPETNAALLEVLNPSETLLHIASKSGSTAETAAQMLAFVPWLENSLGDEANQHVVVSTDPDKGDLRTLVERKGYRSLRIPPHVGGRFSVFGSVGYLPMALFGLDVEAFVQGGADMAERCRGVDDNPALRLAAALHAEHVDKQRNVVVLMSYSDALAFVGDWFGQLWGESLGKNPAAGSTPVRAVGTTDQHSQLQLYMEGPDDKTVLFLRTEQFRSVVPMSSSDLITPSTEYLTETRLGELLRVESLATEMALTKNGRSNASITLDGIDERTLGGLLYFLQLVTVYAGALYDVNPFDQPGVEMGKKLTYGYLGREGFAEQGDALREYEKRERQISRL